jgi:hypothetical protein
MNEVWGSDAGQQSSLSASYSELLRELEVREREVDHLRMYTLSLTPRVSCGRVRVRSRVCRVASCVLTGVRVDRRRSLSAAEKAHNELLNQLREKDAAIDTLRRNEFSYKEEIERLRETLSKYVTTHGTTRHARHTTRHARHRTRHARHDTRAYNPCRIAREAESMELLLRDKEAALQQTTAKDRERKKVP